MTSVDLQMLQFHGLFLLFCVSRLGSCRPTLGNTCWRWRTCCRNTPCWRTTLRCRRSACRAPVPLPCSLLMETVSAEMKLLVLIQIKLTNMQKKKKLSETSKSEEHLQFHTVLPLASTSENLQDLLSSPLRRRFAFTRQIKNSVFQSHYFCFSCKSFSQSGSNSLSCLISHHHVAWMHLKCIILQPWSFYPVDLGETLQCLVTATP